MSNKQQIHILLDKEDLAKLQRLYREKGIGISFMIRKFIKEGLAKLDEPQ